MAGALKLAVFDCDGTLIDSQAVIVATARQAWETLRLPPPEDEQIRRLIGLSLGEAFASLLPDLGAADLERLVATYRDLFAASRRSGVVHEPLFPGMRECLESLEAEGWLLGLATGKSMRGVRATLGAHGLLDKFITVQTADIAAGKPNPDMLLRALAETGADCRRTVMVGDTTYDMQMAVSARTRALGVAWGYHEQEELLAAGAEAMAATCEATFAALNQMMEDG